MQSVDIPLDDLLRKHIQPISLQCAQLLDSASMQEQRLDKMEHDVGRLVETAGPSVEQPREALRGRECWLQEEESGISMLAKQIREDLAAVERKLMAQMLENQQYLSLSLPSISPRSRSPQAPNGRKRSTDVVGTIYEGLQEPAKDISRQTPEESCAQKFIHRYHFDGEAPPSEESCAQKMIHKCHCDGSVQDWSVKSDASSGRGSLLGGKLSYRIENEGDEGMYDLDRTGTLRTAVGDECSAHWNSSQTWHAQDTGESDQTDRTFVTKEARGSVLSLEYAKRKMGTRDMSMHGDQVRMFEEFVDGDDCPRMEEAYDAEKLYKTRGISQRIARTVSFKAVSMLAVIANAVFIGVDSDLNTAYNLYDADVAFQVFPQVFCVYFIFELIVIYFAFESATLCFKDNWFRFDFFLVVSMVVEIWVLMPILKLVSGSDEGSVAIPTQPLRLMRLLKLARMARLAKAFPELAVMIKGLAKSMRATACSCLLVILLAYTTSIFLLILLKNEHEFNDNLMTEFGFDFASMANCLWCLVITGALHMDGAAGIMNALLYSKDYDKNCAGVAFFIFSLISSLLVLQMLIGVMTEIVSEVKHVQATNLATKELKEELLNVLRKDDDSDTSLTQDEFITVLENPYSKLIMKRYNINRLFLFQMQKSLYMTRRSIPLVSALDLLILCRGDNPTTVQSLSNGIMFLARELSLVKRQITASTVNSLEKSLNSHSLAYQSAITSSQFSQLMKKRRYACRPDGDWEVRPSVLSDLDVDVVTGLEHNAKPNMAL